MSALLTRAVGKYERLCFERHERDLTLTKKKGGHPRGLMFNLEAGDRVVKFVESYCHHHKGQWSGSKLLLEEWQKKIIRIVFGWFRADGSRRFRTAYIEIARKNGKSEIAAALGLYLLVGDNEAGAEVYSSATKKDQAKIVWTTAFEMVKRSPDLKRFIKSFKTSLTVPKTSSFFQPLSAESNTLDGLNPHGNIMDELHAHRDRGVWDVLDSAMGARRQPLTVAITTAGTYDKNGIGWEQHEYAQKILDGEFEDDSYFAFIATPDEGDDHFSEVAQQKANPNMGVSANPEYLAKQAEKAKRQPGFLNEYLTKHLNIWTQQSKRWIPMDKWALCETEQPLTADLRALAAVREKLLEGSECRGGLDLSSKLDLTALALEFKKPDGVSEFILRFWLPKSRVEEEAKKGRRHYETWERSGWLTTTPGDVIDYEFIRKEVNELSKKYVLKELAFDPWSATDLATRLMGDGVVMVECRQGFKTLSEPSKDVEAQVVEGKFLHMNNPILRFCASNAVVTADAAGNIKPDKEAASGKIDGIVAAIMARSRSIVIKADEEHAYSTGGFRSL